MTEYLVDLTHLCNDLLTDAGLSRVRSADNTDNVRFRFASIWSLNLCAWHANTTR